MNAPQHLDYDALNALKEVMEDDFIFLIETFLKDSAERMDSLSILIKGDDADAVRRAAHSFKGSCSNLGALYLSSLCSHLEHKGLIADFTEMESDYEAIQQEFLVVQKLMKDYLQ